LVAWLKIASAARTLTDAGVAGSIIVFSKGVAVAEVPAGAARWPARTPPAALPDMRFGTRALSTNKGGFWRQCRRLWRLPQCCAG
jgi:hypothetical protein